MLGFKRRAKRGQIAATANLSAADYQERFRKAGLPLFSDEFRATEDIFLRAAPWLIVVALLEVAGTFDEFGGFWENAAAITSGLIFLVGAYAVMNVWRKSPPFARPSRVGAPEIALFVLAPAMIPPIFNEGQLTNGAITIAVNLLILGGLSAIYAFGLGHIVKGTIRNFRAQLSNLLETATKAIALLLFFSMVMFLTTEMWQVFATIDPWRLVGVGVLLWGTTCMFVALQVPKEVRELEREFEHEFGDAGLSRLQRLNVGVLVFASYLAQMLLVSTAITAFFFIFGSLTITEGIQTSWAGKPPEIWREVPFLGGEELFFSGGIAVISAVIGAFSGLTFAINVTTDETYRSNFLHQITAQVRGAFEDRAAYLALVAGDLQTESPKAQSAS